MAFNSVATNISQLFAAIDVIAVNFDVAMLLHHSPVPELSTTEKSMEFCISLLFLLLSVGKHEISHDEFPVNSIRQGNHLTVQMIMMMSLGGGGGEGMNFFMQSIIISVDIMCNAVEGHYRGAKREGKERGRTNMQ